MYVLGADIEQLQVSQLQFFVEKKKNSKYYYFCDKSVMHQRYLGVLMSLTFVMAYVIFLNCF